MARASCAENSASLGFSRKRSRTSQTNYAHDSNGRPALNQNDINPRSISPSQWNGDPGDARLEKKALTR